MAEREVEAEMLASFPDHPHESGVCFLKAGILLVIHFGDGADEPRVRPFDDQATEHACRLLARKNARDIEMDGTPIPALAQNAGPFQSRPVLCSDAGQENR